LMAATSETKDKEGVITLLENDSKEAKAQVEVLSTKLLESQQAVESHSDRAAELQLRISSLEEELALARKEGESLQGAEADLKTTLAQKEFALLDALASSEARRANEAALRSALQNQEKLLADERVAKDTAERQLVQSSTQVAEMQAELTEMQVSRDEQSSLNQTLQSQLRSSEVAFNAKLEETAHTESILREKLQELSSQLNSKRQLLPDRSNADAEPENEFQQKAKQLRKRIASALRRAADAHHATIDLEIARELQRREPKEARLFEPTAADGGEAMLQTLLQRLSTRRWRIAQELESLLEQVKSLLLLRDAEPTGSGSDVDELVAERLELDIQLIARELVLLRASGALDEVPWSVVKALATFSGIILPRDGKEEQFPMHWAADHGRRDIMEFLLRYPAGEDLLLQRDSQGRIPLFYAERAGNDALALYLRENGPDLHPQEPTLQRPSSANIPAAYEDVIKVVEERGWHAVNWIEGFTLLHWAAEKGLADFCRYFVALNADPNATDSRERTALQCATDSNHRDAELVLRQLMGLEVSDDTRTTSKEPYFRPRSNSEGPESSHWPTQSRRATCVQAVRQNLSQSGSSDGIPEAYLRVMQQIDQIGWDKMCWGRGFTLLHWAAKHDRADLCELFLWHGADPDHRDESNRSAFDYARLRQPQALAALEVLQRGKPTQRPTVQLPTV